MASPELPGCPAVLAALRPAPVSLTGRHAILPLQGPAIGWRWPFVIVAIPAMLLARELDVTCPPSRLPACLPSGPSTGRPASWPPAGCGDAAREGDPASCQLPPTLTRPVLLATVVMVLTVPEPVRGGTEAALQAHFEVGTLGCSLSRRCCCWEGGSSADGAADAGRAVAGPGTRRLCLWEASSPGGGCLALRGYSPWPTSACCGLHWASSLRLFQAVQPCEPMVN